MGCNSHLSIEILRLWGFNATEWRTWALDIPESRDYYLYEAMAGVRGDDENAVVIPRGVPADVSDPIKYWIKRAGEDGHTHSWLYPSEFHLAMQKSRNRDRSENHDQCWLAVDQILSVLESIYGIEHVRIIFFFDN